MRTLLLCLLAAPAIAEEVPELVKVPSGQPVTFQDVIWNAPGPIGLAVRFRFVAPEIATETGSVDFATASDDMLHLCQTYALPRVAENGPAPEQIIISMASAPLPFGETAPTITQFFEAYRVEDDACIWEVY
ncbi:MAG: DUF6497 family protein [Paracoccaceae bacterium]